MQIETDLRSRGIPVRRLFKAAEIAPSTWNRWKAGQTSPTFSTWEKCQTAARQLTEQVA
jgi:hypothetical protein